MTDVVGAVTGRRSETVRAAAVCRSSRGTSPGTPTSLRPGQTRPSGSSEPGSACPPRADYQLVRLRPASIGASLSATNRGKHTVRCACDSGDPNTSRPSTWATASSTRSRRRSGSTCRRRSAVASHPGLRSRPAATRAAGARRTRRRARAPARGSGTAWTSHRRRGRVTPAAAAPQEPPRCPRTAIPATIGRRARPRTRGAARTAFPHHPARAAR